MSAQAQDAAGRNTGPAALRCARFSGEEGKLSILECRIVRRLHGAPTFGVARCFFCIAKKFDCGGPFWVFEVA